jgi:serine/threonine-protein kinase
VPLTSKAPLAPSAPELLQTSTEPTPTPDTDFKVRTKRMSPLQMPPTKIAPLARPAASTADTDIGAPKPSRPSIGDGGPAIHSLPTVGDRIGKYVVDRVIGSGGMGVVVSAKHEALNENVAIKLLRPKAAGDRIHAERFAREARAIIKIKSEHVVRVLDAGTLESGAPFIVMEYLSGRDLAQILREDGPMQHTRAVDLMLQVCEAVASAHAVGVVHRDLKPSNFFVTQRTDGSTLVKVLDFGISKAMGQEGLVDPNLTETQAVFGSPTYMSPEQIRSAKHVDHRSDIWSLGVGLFELITGKLPFAADNVAGLLASIVADPPFFPHAFAPSVPEGLEEILLHCLAKDARQRVQTVADLAFRLAAFATPTIERDDLVDRIDRLARAMGQSTTGPRLPLPLPGPALPPPVPASLRATARPLSHSVPVSEPRHVAAADAPSSSVAFGSTGMELSSETSAGRQSSTAGAVAIGLCVAGAVLVAGFGAYELGVRRSAPAAVRPTAAPSAAAAAPLVSSSPSSSASAPVPVDSASSTSTPPSADSSATAATKPSAMPPRRPTPRHMAPRPPTKEAPPPPKPVDPTNDRF